jgi:hypothetical protein
MQHCQDMRREATDLHAQLNSSWGVMQNSRLVWQDRQVRSDVTRCPN